MKPTILSDDSACTMVCTMDNNYDNTHNLNISTMTFIYCAHGGQGSFNSWCSLCYQESESFLENNPLSSVLVIRGESSWRGRGGVRMK